MYPHPCCSKSHSSSVALAGALLRFTPLRGSSVSICTDARSSFEKRTTGSGGSQAVKMGESTYMTDTSVYIYSHVLYKHNYVCRSIYKNIIDEIQ